MRDLRERKRAWHRSSARRARACRSAWLSICTTTTASSPNESQGFRGAGYRRIKLKVAPGRDDDVVGARGPIGATWFSGSTRTVATYPPNIRRSRGSIELGLGLIEQPLAPDDLAGHARLRRATSPRRSASTSRSAGRPRPSIARATGRDGHQRQTEPGGRDPRRGAHPRHVPAFWCRRMGRRHARSRYQPGGQPRRRGVRRVHASGDISATTATSTQDITTPFKLDEDGYISVPTGLGIGIELDEDFIAAHTNEVCTIKF